ncbi:signal peptidase I [Aquihabitans daechungensis]|uniref:signal peptidase I n=1 Tax=Aquihabitans daechungensis TaxID=1052257 RepID=UPI003B9E8EE0
MLVGVTIIVILGGAVLARARRRSWVLDQTAMRWGVTLLAVGLASYLLVRWANGGHLPSTADALRTAGRATVDRAGRPVPELTDRRLGLLGNLLAWPAPLPLATVIGLPQILVLAGIATALRLPPRRGDVTRLDLEAGRFWWDAAPGDAEHLEVQLRGSVVRADTARLGIDISDAGGVLIVIEGMVTIEQPGGTITVEEGHGVALSPDGVAGPPERLRARDLMDDPWVGPHLDDVGTARTAPVLQRRLWPVAAVLATMVVAAMVVVTYVAQIASVPSESMAPTLSTGDRVLVAKAVGAPEPPDVVVFERPASLDEGPTLLVKRVVAIGGQSVAVRDGRVFVDGRALPEPYLPAGVETEEPCGPKGVVEVPAGALFVLGDNRPDSFDSRCFGPIRLEQLVGTVVRGVVPLSGTP